MKTEYNKSVMFGKINTALYCKCFVCVPNVFSDLEYYFKCRDKQSAVLVFHGFRKDCLCDGHIVCLQIMNIDECNV